MSAVPPITPRTFRERMGALRNLPPFLAMVWRTSPAITLGTLVLRLARALLLLARYGKEEQPSTLVPRISQETLAEMIGTTRSRVNFFLNKFKKLGFIEYDGELPLKINSSLLSVVLHD